LIGFVDIASISDIPPGWFIQGVTTFVGFILVTLGFTGGVCIGVGGGLVTRAAGGVSVKLDCIGISGCIGTGVTGGVLLGGGVGIGLPYTHHTQGQL